MKKTTVLFLVNWAIALLVGFVWGWHFGLHKPKAWVPEGRCVSIPAGNIRAHISLNVRRDTAICTDADAEINYYVWEHGVD